MSSKARRADTLSKARIVAAAIEILDSEGENGLNFRVLAGRLETGAGAIYWHVANKSELLGAAANAVIGDALVAGETGADPRERIRSLALSVFDAIDDHPWVGAQLTREPWQPALLQVFEGIGGGLKALEVPQRDQFTLASVLLNYILGGAGQNAANAREIAGRGLRTEFLEGVAARWAQLDPDTYPFIQQSAAELSAHDDREQFLAGIDLILIGMRTLARRRL